MEICAESLKKWNRDHFGHIGHQLRRLEDDIKECQAQPNDPNREEKLRSLEKQFLKLQDREEIMWRQRAKSLWLVCGDKKYKVFP